MAHFAEIDENNVVLRVLVVPDSEQHRGEQYLAGDLMLGGTWIQCSYSERLRNKFPGAGYIYDVIRDVFIPPKPFASWVMDESTYYWVAPVVKPDDGNIYVWKEPRGWTEVK